MTDMNITVQPGRYVVAVSGGVDSMVLLDLLRQKPDLHLIIAHFDHGIRGDSTEDRHLVQQIAHTYDMPFVYDEGHLGSQASQATARSGNYNGASPRRRDRNSSIKPAPWYGA